ncbi:pca operon transcription factor PcaQ [Yoonia sp.]|uniref:pca operon transcription factor PcaQ n=1 Tax=Yoonia sp. TaxID=2212373 RepID=UPI0025CBD766|nr:pca operon transcription factor PcaQ [Yoonia sp.]
MDRRIKFRHLEAFICIARAKSLKAAADMLNLTQPAVSKTLKDLETILGVTLMDRGRAGVRLRPEGAVFLQFAEQSTAALQSGLTSIASLGTAGGMLTIGALPSVSARLLPAAVNIFRRTAPDTVLQLLEGPHAYLTDHLRSGALDLVVGRMGRPDSMKNLSFTQLHEEKVVIVAAPGHPLAGAVRLDQIKGHPVIYPPKGSAIRPLVARLMIASGLALFDDRIETTSAAFGRAMALGSAQAVWFISQGVVDDDIATGRLVKLAINMEPTIGPVGIMARSEENPTPVAHLFRQSLFQAAAPPAARS